MASLTLLSNSPTKVQLKKSASGQGGGVLDRISDMATDVTDALGITEDDALLTFDVSIEETHEIKADVTKFPVETGSDITDNYRVQPYKLTITGEVTDTPLLAIPGAAAVTGVVDTVQSFMGESPKSIQAYDKFKGLFANATMFDCVTGLTLYSNMVITSLSIPKNIKFGNTLRFTATFEEIRVVDAAYAYIPGITPPASQVPKDARPTRNAGNRGTPAPLPGGNTEVDALESHVGGYSYEPIMSGG